MREETHHLVTEIKAMIADDAERRARHNADLDATLTALADQVGITEAARLVGLSRKNVDKRVQRHRRGA